MSLISKSCDRKGKEKVFRLHLNQVASCCQAYPTDLDHTKTFDHYTDLWQQERQQLDQGQEILSCETCWKKENQGFSSYRNAEAYPNIEIFTSNLCNQMCSYCSPKYSSTWQESITTDGEFKNISFTAKRNQSVSKIVADHQEHWIREIDRYISQQPENSIELKLLGGEPLMQIHSLQQLLKMNTRQIHRLVIQTNLNPPSQRFLHWILENFPSEKLVFSISIDSTPEYNHVPRAGFQQDTFMANLKLLSDHAVTCQFVSVISVTSIFDIANFCRFLDHTGYSTSFDQINNPDCLDPIYLPTRFKQHILDTQVLLPNLVTEILNTDTKVVDLKLFEQYNYLKQYFTRAGIDPTTTPNVLFNEYWTWLSNKGF
jgi:sulfatase maturation enzyme AslB (radical SAM superfamily)